MTKDSILNGNYSSKKIKSLNDVKAKKSDKNKKNNVNGNNGSIFDDINSYKNDKTKQTDNDELFKYIEESMGMNNFLELLDADGDGEISKSEASKISSYDDDDKLTSNDINNLIDDINNLSSAKETEKNGNKITEAEYETDKNGQLVKKSAVEKDSKTDKVTAEMTYEDGKIKTSNDKIKNRTTTYKYDSSGKLESSKLTMNDEENTLMYESFYDEKGRVKNMREYVNEIWKTRGDFYHVFEYDDNNRVNSINVYKGTDDNGEKHAEYHYTYDDKTGLTLKREDGLSGETLEYKYDENNKLVSSIRKDEDGNITGYATYNPDGSIATMKEGDFTSVYSYCENNGFVKEKTTYNNSDVDDDGKVKENAKPTEKIMYEDGKEKRKAVYEDDKTSYYENGLLTAEVKGEYTYVYEYDKDNNQTKAIKYKSSDCVDGVPKDGATIISTEDLTVKSTIDTKLSQKVDERLGSGFCKEVEKLATQMKCNAEDILVMMFSESGLDPHAGDGSFSAGLTQFIAGCEPTVDGYTPSIYELNNMSAIEQMKYIGPSLLECKTQLAGLSPDSVVDTGTLYAINFLPAFAGNEVLCSAGDIYYNSNSPLDFDGDGQITKTDLANHLNKKRAEMYQDFGL